MSQNRQIFSLKQVVASIRKTIDERYKQMYWVKAEMHKLNRFASGHCFPELLQKEDGKIVAQINGTIWKHNFEQINKKFIEVVKEPLKEDTTLLLMVKVNFHEVYGMSLQIMDIDPNYALGELQRERQETLKRLQKEGLLNLNQQLEFPLLPKRVAVISADSSKGLSDFKKVIEQNEWGYQFFTMLFPAYLQGDLAANSIMTQLNRIEKVRRHFDVVVIVRGGGGEVGLSCYNSFDLCKAIATFPLPVLSGIGHSTNLTVAEMISYRNAITPTELADFLLQSFHDFAFPLKETVTSIKNFSKMTLDKAKSDLNSTSKYFRNAAVQYLQKSNHLLSTTGQQMKSDVRHSMQNRRQIIQKEEQKLVSNVRFLLQKNENGVERVKGEVPLIIKNIYLRENSKLDQLNQSIRLMDPIHLLQRGYSITTINGKAIAADTEINKGDIIQTSTVNLVIQSEVMKVDKKNE